MLLRFDFGIRLSVFKFVFELSESGQCDQVIDRSYRFAEYISALTRAADQPGGLPGVSHSKEHTTLIFRDASRLDAFSGYHCPT